MARPELALISPIHVVTEAAPSLTEYVVPDTPEVQVLGHEFLREWMLQFNDPASYSPILPPQTVSLIVNDIPHCKVLATQTVKLILSTIGKKKSTLLASLENVSFAESLKCFDRIHMVLLAAKTKVASQETELQYLETAIDSLTVFKKAYRSLQALSQEQNIMPLKNLSMMCIVRAICLPTVPEDAQGGVLSVARTVTDNFVKGIVQTIVKNLEQMFEISTMPSIEDVQQFITNMREKQKQKSIDEFETLTIADQELLREAKKLGLVKKDRSVVEEENNSHDQQEDEEADYATTGGDNDVPIDDL